ncbi:hypothetical protein NPIL_14831 [Nephila pilipes]|uniref:Uncharacterized protein n=1 Tax=Nephila pilipes TaxID=299642 RepID=A0A8X6QJ54_NEPPI|nr:hypothetical protein NPIL_14831 [Nephila pilipes]
MLSRHLTASTCNRVLTSDEKWVLYDASKRYLYWLSFQYTMPFYARPPMHQARLSFLSSGQVIKWFTMSCDQWAKRLLQTYTRSNWSVCNSHCNRRSLHW